jgi:hypothetical protein
MYVLYKNGVKQYPYTLTDMIFANPNTSFPSTITDAVAAQFGVYPVQEVAPPAYDYATQNLSSDAVLQGGSWVQVWSVTSASSEEIAQRRDGQASMVRSQRDQLLHANVDVFNAIRWEALDDATKQQWRDYRQELLDVPQQAGFPWNVTWPVVPT